MSAAGQIKSFVDRVLRLKEEQDEIGRDIREIYAEAKAMGLDKTQLGNVVSHVRKVEKKGRDAIDEGNAIFDMYLAAYEGTGMPVATRAHTHEVEPHDPETGEILESVQSHEALVLSAPAESASGEISATNTSVESRERQKAGEPVSKPEATPKERSLPSVGPSGTAATNSNPQASSSRQADKAETAPPVVSATFNNPRCQNPKTCHLAHSRETCWECSMAWSQRPAEEQKRLWAEATGVAA